MDVDDDDDGDEMVDLTEGTAQQALESEGEEEDLVEEEEEGEAPDIPLQPPGRGKARRAPRVWSPCVGTQAKKLAESFFEAFVVPTAAGKKGNFTSYHFVRPPNAAEKAQGHNDEAWPRMHELFNQCFYCNITQGIFWAVAVELKLAVIVDSSIHQACRMRWACGAAILGGSSEDKQRYNAGVQAFQSGLAARYTRSAAAAEANTTPFEHLHRRLRTEYEPARLRAIRALVNGSTPAAAGAGPSAAPASSSAAAGPSGAEPAAGGAAGPQAQGGAGAPRQAPAAAARVDPPAFGVETVTEFGRTHLVALEARFGRFASSDSDAAALLPVFSRFMEHLRLRMPAVGAPC